MKYWVIKGNPKWYKWDRDLRPKHVERWGSRFKQPDMAADDRLFLWESGHRRRLIGFGEVVQPQQSRGRNGLCAFKVRYLTNRLQVMPDIEDLRQIRSLRAATFLNPGPFGTLYQLSLHEARALYQAAISKNRHEHIWRDLGNAGTPAQAPELEVEALEGNPKLVTHLRRERDPSLAKRKKCHIRTQHGKLFCEACGRDHSDYGALADNVFEVHHTRPLAKYKKAEKTKLSDLGVLCSNCHRAIHRTKPMRSIAAFKRLLAS